MNEHEKQGLNLTPQKRKLLQQLIKKEGLDGPDTSTITRRQTQSPIPLSFAQQRLWFLDQLEPGNSVYNIPIACRITGPFQISLFQRSIDDIIHRHEILRTIVRKSNGVPEQLIKQHTTLPINVIDLTDTPDAEKKCQIRERIIIEGKKPFDLSHGPLIRISVIRLGVKELILIIVMHHIVSDGWSSRLFFSELSQLYKAFSQGKPSPLSELPLQYGDFVLWQRSWLQGEILESQLRYWKKQLDKTLHIIDLPFDHPRPSIQTHRGNRSYFQLSDETTTGLKRRCRQTETTMYMMLLAAFNALLYRYSGQDDITIGTPIANRNRTDTENLIGFFVNTLALRNDLSGDPSFEDLLHRVKEVALGAYDHQDLPFELLVDELKLERTLSHTPLFQVMFIFQNFPEIRFKLPDVDLKVLEMDTRTAKFDLTMIMVETEKNLKGSIEYSTDLFEPDTISRMIVHFQILLKGIIANPDKRLSELPVLTDQEIEVILKQWNHTESEYPKHTSIHQLFQMQCRKTPDRIALTFGKDRITFQELNTKSNQLANHLIHKGVNPGSFIAICMVRSMDMVIGMLAILKTGGVYIPLDPTHPEARIGYMIEDANAPFVLTHSKWHPIFSSSQAKTICLDLDRHLINKNDSENIEILIPSDSPAYVIYTSGSTGTPKGVIGLHRGAINRFTWMWKKYPFTVDEVCCQKTAMGFVDSVWEIFGPLLQGIPSIIIPDDIVRDPLRLVQCLSKYQVTRIVLVPSILKMLLNRAADIENQLHRLKLCISSGEALSPELVKQFKKKLSRCKLLNLYGSTETAGDVTYYETDNMSPDITNVPIGRPIDNTQIYILDSNLQPVPVGITGEIAVGGDGQARGYLNRPQLTSKSFISNPFENSEQSRLFMTGDLARYQSDGNIQLVGRIDHQVKWLGNRIEPGEIEATLRNHKDIEDAVVMLREDDSNEEQLVAYITAREKRVLKVDQLNLYLKEKLPDYMIPSAFGILGPLPLNPHGKIDRLALPPLGHTRPDMETSYQPPVDPEMKKVCSIWENMLNIKPVGINDDFFVLGGNSLLAVRLFAEMEKIYDKVIPLTVIFQAPTIEQLVPIIREERYTTPHTSMVEIHSEGSRPPFYCISAGEHVTGFVHLSRSLGKDQPFYALPAYPQAWSQDFDFTMEDLAAHYVKEIRSFQSKGPYMLGGFCIGGLVALEMARQLVEQGHKVGIVALIESRFSRPRPAKKSISKVIMVWFYFLFWLIRLRYHLNKIFFLTLPQKIPYIQALIERVKQKTKTTFTRRKAEEDLTVSILLEQDMARAHRTALLKEYTPRPYPGQISVFQATDRIVTPHENYRWRSLAQGGANIHKVPGSHQGVDMQRPFFNKSVLDESNVWAIAEKLKIVIENVLQTD